MSRYSAYRRVRFCEQDGQRKIDAFAGKRKKILEPAFWIAAWIMLLWVTAAKSVSVCGRLGRRNDSFLRFYQRVERPYFRETAKIAVGGPKGGDAVVKADGRYPRVVNQAAYDPSSGDQPS